jgi:glycosyltransferase involved in cell wall biosynthesis
MKVLVCIPSLLTGGTEIQTLSLVKALVAAGHEVVVVCYFEYADPMVVRYRKAGAVVELLNPDGSRPIGVKNTVINLWKGLRGVVRKYRPDVAHVQYMAPGALPILVLRTLGMKKIIATAHTSADIYPSLKQIHWINNHILTAFQCITLKAETSFFGNASLFSNDTKLKRHGNHFTIYNNLPSYIDIVETPRKGTPKTIGVVSRLERIKGMDLVVPAFAEVYKHHPELKLLIVGDGTQREFMEQQVHKVCLPEDSVQLVGRQNQDKLQSFYDQIEILLMPSRSEGFGLTAIEGMARGCVPIVSNTGGLPEVVEDGISGLLHTSESIENMAAKIESIIDTPELFEQLSLGAYNRARAFSKEKYQKQIAKLYSLMHNAQ